ncbi:MAG: CPBP family intramembrane glutamic endopeptidase [Candidatus Saccharimonadales bacterium]
MWQKIRKEFRKLLVSKAAQAKNQRALSSLRYGPFSAVWFVVGAYILASVGTSLLLSLYPLSQGWSQAETTAWLKASPIAQFFMFLLASVLIVVIAYVCLRMRKQSLQKVGVTRPTKWDAARGLLAYVPYMLMLMVVVAFVAGFVPSIDVNQEQEIFTAPTAGSGLLLVFLALAILPPLAEEFIFRGVLYTGLRKKFSFVWTTLIVSVIFGSLHLTASSDGPLWIAAVDTAILSFFLCYLREKTGSIWAGVTLHFVKNFIAFVTLFVIK